jgi:hypothetical protein
MSNSEAEEIIKKQLMPVSRVAQGEAFLNLILLDYNKI